MPDEKPKVERAIKPEFIDLSLRVQVDQDGNYTLFGQPSFICPEHSNDIRSIQECFLDNLVSLIKDYAFMPDEKLSDGAQKLKKRIFNAVWITYPSPPEPDPCDRCGHDRSGHNITEDVRFRGCIECSCKGFIRKGPAPALKTVRGGNNG